MKEAIELLCDKLGMAVDWTAQNVWPQVMEVLQRYRTYSIVDNAIGIIICLAFVGAFICVNKHIIEDRKTLIDNRGIRRKEERDRVPHDQLTKPFTTIWWDWYDYHGEAEPTGVSIALWVAGGILAIFATVGFFVAVENLIKWIFIPEVQWLDVIKSATGK